MKWFVVEGHDVDRKDDGGAGMFSEEGKVEKMDPIDV
jgi:hypothetical protein